MGTSSMYKGPSGNPLLPSDFEDPLFPDVESNNEGENEADESNQNEVNDSEATNVKGQNNEEAPNDNIWRDAKSYMSRVASGNSSNYKKAVSYHVRACGGARIASKAAVSGVKSTANFGGFISGSYREGIRNVLNRYQIDYEGKSAKDILTDVINILAPIPVTKEGSVARKALIRTMEVLYEILEDENDNISTLEKIDEDLLNRIIPIQIESYIYERILNDLGYRIETKVTTANEAINIESELQDYIKSKVETTLKGYDFANFEFLEKKVESLFNQCYKVMEDMV